ncbi:MAG: uracil-DNA glycosylase [Candidatus Muirbacterium halophilum]|nr:uracil-DNA glycosylase [Candidatus Muirbacterium halophilum]MCK9475707.1 uracil-DNA glycosylase [Candidatus Muirbacterium halophilum]
MDKKLEINELCNTIENCTLCRLSETRIKTVPGMGNIESKILVVGEGPGEEEDKSGIPFVGKAGQLLTKIFEAVEFDREKDMFITNIVKCRPPENRNPEKDEIALCSPYLFYIIEIMKPSIIITLGNAATKFFLDKKDGISKLRGNVYDWNDIKVIPMYHPSYIVRNERNENSSIIKKQTWQDIKLVKNLYNTL